MYSTAYQMGRQTRQSVPFQSHSLCVTSDSCECLTASVTPLGNVHLHELFKYGWIGFFCFSGFRATLEHSFSRPNFQKWTAKFCALFLGVQQILCRAFLFLLKGYLERFVLLLLQDRIVLKKRCRNYCERDSWNIKERVVRQIARESFCTSRLNPTSLWKPGN